jgi:hypothetical protein
MQRFQMDFDPIISSSTHAPKISLQLLILQKVGLISMTFFRRVISKRCKETGKVSNISDCSLWLGYTEAIVNTRLTLEECCF